MAINFNNNKFDSISKIKNRQEGGKDFFDEEEKGYFFGIASVGKAQKVANLLAKIKEYKTKKKWELVDLNNAIDDLKAEETQGTYAFRFLEGFDLLISNTISRLTSKYKFQDDKKLTEAERKARETELNIEIAKLRKAQGKNAVRRQSLKSKRNRLFNEKNVEESLTKNRDKIFNLLKVDSSSRFIDPSDGQEKRLSDISLVVKSYTGGGVSQKDDELTDQASRRIVDLISDAQGFLNDMTNYRLFDNSDTTSQTIMVWSPHLSGFFRSYNDKNSVAFRLGEIGHSYLLVLRDIGEERLKKLVKEIPNLGDSDKEKLEGYAKEFTEYVHPGEYIYEKDWKEMIRLDKEQRERIRGRNIKKIFGSDYNSYPHVMIPNWEHIFEFMKIVFPIEGGSNADDVGFNVLKARDYLDDSSDPNYLSPSDKNKRGWENFFIEGWAQDVPGSEKVKHRGSVTRYVKNDANAPKILKEQLKNPREVIPSDWEFKRLTQLWWNVFIPYMEDAIDPTRNGWANNSNYDLTYLTGPEKMKEAFLCQVRYFRLMKEIFSKMNILSSSEKEMLDDILIKISEDASDSFFKSENEVKNLKKWHEFFNRPAPFRDEGVRQLEWTDQNFVYKNTIEKIIDLYNQRKSRVDSLKSEIDSLDSQIGSLNFDDADKQKEIDDYRYELELLQEDEEFDNKDLEGKKKLFEDSYNKKKDGKWIYKELQAMEVWLEAIKTEMNDDAAFDAEFKTKKTEIDNFLEGAREARKTAAIYNWDQARIETDTLEQAIIRIRKEKEKTGFGLEEVKNFYEKFKNHVNLTDSEQNEYDRISDAIKNPEDYKDKPASGLSKEKLTTIFGFNADDELLTSWQTIDSLDETKIASAIGDYVKGKSKFNDLMAHLKEKGDSFSGENINDYSDASSDDDTKKGEVWEKFIKKGPKVVIETIVAHEFEELKKDATKLQAKKDEIKGKDKIKLDDYGTDSEVSEDGVKKFMYQEKIGAEYNRKVEDKKDENPETPNEEPSKSWFIPSKDNIWRPCVTYIGGTLVIVGILAVIFWEKVADWWNGPAEEQGENKTEESEKDEENE